MEWGAVITGVIGALLGGGIVSFFKFKSENRVNDSEAWGTLVSNLQNELTRQAERLTRMEKDLEHLKQENNRLERRAEQLEEEKARLIEENTRLKCELEGRRFDDE